MTQTPQYDATVQSQGFDPLKDFDSDYWSMERYLQREGYVWGSEGRRVAGRDQPGAALATTEPAPPALEVKPTLQKQDGTKAKSSPSGRKNQRRGYKR